MFENTITKTQNLFGRAQLYGKKYAPELLLGAGLVTIGVGFIMGCKASTKLESTVDRIDNVKAELSANAQDADEEKKLLAGANLRGAMDITMLYLPSVSTAVIGTGMVLASYNIMKKRNLALAIAYKSIEDAFARYRKRVADEFGEEKEHEIRYGAVKEKVTIVDEDGKKKKVEQITYTDGSIYDTFFDETSSLWQKDAVANTVFVKSIQNWANDKLNARGHLFLNEVLDELGLPQTPIGALVGWVKGNGDDYVDFGIWGHDDVSEATEEFKAGIERSVLLRFNVDGQIYDLLK